MSFEYLRYIINEFIEWVMIIWFTPALIIIILTVVWIIGVTFFASDVTPFPDFLHWLAGISFVPIFYISIPFVLKKRRDFYKNLNKNKRRTKS